MEKQRWEESEKRREEERRSEKRKNQKEDAAARKGRKVAKHCVFPMICGSAEPSGQMRDEQLHAIVARSTFRSQMCKAQLRGGTNALHRGARQISKSKCLDKCS